MRILTVQPNEGLAEFIEFPWSVYRNDPLWIPPLREQTLRELSGASPFARYGRSRLFVCEAEGRIAGRIAALANFRLADADGNLLGQLGYFECIDDRDVAKALVDAGLNWLKSEGARQVLAPMNGGAHRTHRLLTRGFDRDPFLFEPRNPPYYPRLFKHCGFAPVKRWFSYELRGQQIQNLLSEFDSSLSRKPVLGVIEDLHVEEPEAVLGRLLPLLDQCWTGHVAYAPLEMEEFAEVFAGALSIARRGNLGVLVGGGRDLGYSFSYPDYAAEVRALAGSSAGWENVSSKPQPQRIVMHTAALIPEARNRGAGIALIARIFRYALAAGFDEMMLALAIEGFLENVVDHSREYALYARTV